MDTEGDSKPTKPRRRYKNYSGWSHVAQATGGGVSQSQGRRNMVGDVVGARGASLGGPYDSAVKAHVCVAVDESPAEALLTVCVCLMGVSVPCVCRGPRWRPVRATVLYFRQT
eukprot:scaffold100341_cov66-Phaeocystis_antarctica.AAC.1